MNSIENIFEDLKRIISDVFPGSETEIEPTTQAVEVDGWDSLNHAILISSIESHFHIRLPIEKTFEAKNVGELAELIFSNR